LATRVTTTLYKSADMCIIIISPLGYTILLKTVHPSAKPRLSPGGMKNRFPFCGSRALGALSPPMFVN
jgi:hypothetical protein